MASQKRFELPTDGLEGRYRPAKSPKPSVCL